MPFKKGQSGNPAGRKKKTPDLVEVEALAREFTPEAIKRLAHWMRSDNAKASVSAASILIDRAHGKAIQKQDVRVTDDRMVVQAPEPSKDAAEWSGQHGPH